MAQMNKTSGKEINEMEINDLSDAEFKTLVIRMLKEITGYCNSIKKTQEEIKVTLSEITVEWMKLRIKSMIWNIKKKKIFTHNSKKEKGTKKRG